MKISIKSDLSITAKASKQQVDCAVCRGDLLKCELLNRCGRCGVIVHDECGEKCPIFACDGDLTVVNRPKQKKICIYCLRSIEKRQQLYRCGLCGTLYHSACGSECPNSECSESRAVKLLAANLERRSWIQRLLHENSRRRLIRGISGQVQNIHAHALIASTILFVLVGVLAARERNFSEEEFWLVSGLFLVGVLLLLAALRPLINTGAAEE